MILTKTKINQIAMGIEKYGSDDALIIQLLKEGNPDVIDLLYGKYEHMVRATAYDILLDREKAEDAKQEIFIRIYEILSEKKTLSIKGEVGGYLYIMTRNLSLNMKRSDKYRDNRNLVYSEHLPQVTTPVDDIDHERTQKVDKVLAKQSPERRDAYQLVIREGKTYEEAAKETGKSKHTVRILVTRTIKELKSKLGKKFLLFL